MKNALALICLFGATSAAQAPWVAGIVFNDSNGNGLRDPGERGIPNVVVSNQDDVVSTDAAGVYRIARGPTGVVFVSTPNGFRNSTAFWHSAENVNSNFGLSAFQAPRDFTFVHASDTHIAPAVLVRTQRLRAMSDSVNPAFVIITGDLVRDALRVGEAEATGYYELFASEAAKFRNPVWTVPGNHENFGIERTLSKVSSSHPLYGRAMYRHYRGPDYYSFTYGGVHFVGLNSVDIDDQWYYGHVDSVQVAWLTHRVSREGWQSGRRYVSTAERAIDSDRANDFFRPPNAPAQACDDSFVCAGFCSAGNRLRSGSTDGKSQGNRVR